MPYKPAFSQSLGKAVGSFVRSLALAGLVAGSAALVTTGCTDNGGNGHFVPPNPDAAAGSGGGGGQGGDGAGGTSSGGDSGGGTGGGGGASAGGTSGGGTSGGGTGGASNDDGSAD